MTQLLNWFKIITTYDEIEKLCYLGTGWLLSKFNKSWFKFTFKLLSIFFYSVKLCLWIWIFELQVGMIKQITQYNLNENGLYKITFIELIISILRYLIYATIEDVILPQKKYMVCFFYHFSTEMFWTEIEYVC